MSASNSAYSVSMGPFQTNTGTHFTYNTNSKIRFLDPEPRQCEMHAGPVGELGCTRCDEVQRANKNVSNPFKEWNAYNYFNIATSVSASTMSFSQSMTATAGAVKNFSYQFNQLSDRILSIDKYGQPRVVQSVPIKPSKMKRMPNRRRK